jgi:hypothetical protein
VKNPAPTPVALTVEEARAIAWRTFALTDNARAVYLAMPYGEIVVDRAGSVTPAADYDALRAARFEADQAKAA